MNTISLVPYTIIQDKDYTVDTKIVIKKSDFNEVAFQGSKITFSFINCRFRKIEIENFENIDFEGISIQFFNCFITEILVETILTTNISIFFGSSILQGRLKNNNLRNITLNNCLLNDSIFLLDLNSVNVSFTEENIFPIRWKRLFKSVKAKFSDFAHKKQSYFIYDSKNITFNVNENTSGKTGLYVRPYSYEQIDKFGYYFSKEEIKLFDISLSLQYSPDVEHKQTKIINAILSGLTLQGFANGEQTIENSKIDNWYIHNFSSQNGANFYDIKPYRQNIGGNKLEFHKSNLDKVWFDNISFNDYDIISFYRNKFGQTTLTSCEFPDDYKGFDKFKTVENIHYPDKRTDNYYKTRYETFLQLKKLLEASGNFYEAQKFQSVSNEALKNIENISFWDKLILTINSFSNNHGLSIREPLKYTILLSIVFYVLYLWSIGRMFNSNTIDFNLIGHYFAFLDITHRSDFLVNKSELSGWSVAIDYFNKILIGFLIYQFIAAFRKYGKK